MKAFIDRHSTAFRLIALFVAIGMTAWLIFFAFSLNGNPVSYFLVKSSSQKYVAESYPGYVADAPAYNFKFGRYAVQIAKPNSEDCHFMADFGLDGKCLGDNFDSSINKGFNTATRLNMRYRELVDTVLESPVYPFESKIAFGELIFAHDYDEGVDPVHDFSLPIEILKPDALYDLTSLGEEAGVIMVYVHTEDKSPERAAEILQELDALMTQGGVTFRAINLSLTSNDAEDFYIENLHREEISDENLPQIVVEKHNAFEQRLAKIEK